MAGREVEIPTTVNTIIPLGNAPRMITYLGLGDKAVGIENCEIGKISAILNKTFLSRHDVDLIRKKRKKETKSLKIGNKKNLRTGVDKPLVVAKNTINGLDD